MVPCGVFNFALTRPSFVILICYFLFIEDEYAPLDLYCHGSEIGQAFTFVELAGADTGESMVSLTCIGGVFKRLIFEVTPNKVCNIYSQQHYFEDHCVC